MAQWRGKAEADSIEALLLEMNHTRSRKRLEDIKASMLILDRWSPKAQRVYLMNKDRLPDARYDGS